MYWNLLVLGASVSVLGFPVVDKRQLNVLSGTRGVPTPAQAQALQQQGALARVNVQQISENAYRIIPVDASATYSSALIVLMPKEAQINSVANDLARLAPSIANLMSTNPRAQQSQAPGAQQPSTPSTAAGVGAAATTTQAGLAVQAALPVSPPSASQTTLQASLPGANITSVPVAASATASASSPTLVASNSAANSSSASSQSSASPAQAANGSGTQAVMDPTGPGSTTASAPGTTGVPPNSGADSATSNSTGEKMAKIALVTTAGNLTRRMNQSPARLAINEPSELKLEGVHINGSGSVEAPSEEHSQGYVSESSEGPATQAELPKYGAARGTVPIAKSLKAVTAT